MQTAIKRVLNDGFAGLEYLENIKVRVNGQVLTDIDLVVLEKATGNVLLCQLKHQELYGADIHIRQARTTRLKDEIGRWLNAISNWMTAVGEVGVRSSFRVPKSFPRLTIYRVAISRHYAHPLRELAQGAETAYANWN